MAPTAATRMTENLMPESVLNLLGPEAVTLGLLARVLEGADAGNRMRWHRRA